MRIEHDFLGEVTIEDHYYYGAQTFRALHNFQISSHKLCEYPMFIHAFAIIKQAATRANKELGLLDITIADAIDSACQEIKNGALLEQFQVDMYQGGAGTSTNMNINEVIANRALEILGHEKGQYQYCHPNNHVNLSQSTNDTYPSSLQLAIYFMLTDVNNALEQLIQQLSARAREWNNHIKMGRTQLQDAVPMTSGQEFEAFAASLRTEKRYLQHSSQRLLEMNMGATAIGTGINTHKDYSDTCLMHLAKLTHLPIHKTENIIEATWDTGAFVAVSASMKALAIKLSKICNDLRLLSSGPCCGFDEINLPRRQPGSSIMPGKVNPVIPELVNQIAFRVMGNDHTICLASEAAQLQLNVMEPVIAIAIFESITLLCRGMKTLEEKCIAGITINVAKNRSSVEQSIAIVTALNPILGYETTSALVHEAETTRESIYNLVLKHNYLKEPQLKQILSPENMTSPNIPDGQKIT